MLLLGLELELELKLELELGLIRMDLGGEDVEERRRVE